MRLKLFLLACLYWFCASAFAFNYSAGYYATYEVPTAYGMSVVYVVPKPSVLIVASDINIPIAFMPEGGGIMFNLVNGVPTNVRTTTLTANDMAALGATPSSYKLFSGDADGDGQSDLLLQGVGSRSSVIITYGASGPRIHYNFGSALDANRYVTSFADTNGDGHADVIIVSGPEGYGVYVNGGSSFTYTQPPAAVPGTGLVALLDGELAVTPTGAASYTVPVLLPPGSAGVAPKLSFSYSSQAGNGTLGVGWSLGGLTAVTRCPATIAQDGFNAGINFDANDRFCLDGQRLVAISGAYGADGTEYRTELNSFSKIVSYGSAGAGPGYFKVWTKSGELMEFGVSADARAEAQGRADVLTWALNKVSDGFGNYFSVTYTEVNASGEHYPQRIDYTGNSNLGQSPYNSVQFIYENRPDPISGYVGGSRVAVNKRLTSLRTYADSVPVTFYNFQYMRTVAGQPSQIIALTKCDGAGTCQPSVTFSWTAANNSPSFRGAGSGWWTGHSLGMARNMAGDFDGDGKTDIAGFAGNGLWDVRLSTGNWFNAAGNWAGYGGGAEKAVAGDFNGDGKTDIIGRLGNGLWDVRFSTGSGFVSAGTWSGHNGGTDNNLVGDFNGDGRTDLAAYNGNGQWDVRLSTGSGFSAAFWSGPWSSAANCIPADFNGDGMSDIGCYIDAQGGYWDVRLSTGSSFNGPASGGLWPGGPLCSPVNCIAADFNGDGMTDLARNTGNGSSNWEVRLSTGRDFNGVGSGLWNGFPAGASSCTSGDFNGDGLADIACFKNDQWNVMLSTGTNFNAAGSGTWAGHGMGIGNNVTGDFNGDGVSDLLGLVRSNSWDASLSDNLSGRRLITAVTDGLGGVSSIAYRPLTDASVYTKDTDAVYPVRDIQAAMYVVSTLESPNGIGGRKSVGYRYEGLKAHLQGRGSLGFRKMTVTDNQTGISLATTYSQTFPTIGMPVSTIQKLSNGQLLSQSNVTYTDKLISNNGINTHFPYASQSVEQSYHLDNASGQTSLLTIATTTSTYDHYGSALTVNVEKTGNGESFTTASRNTYLNYPTVWQLGRLSHVEVTSTASGKTPVTRVSDFEYHPVTRVLTREIIEPNTTDASIRLTTTHAYDDWGNRVSKTDCAGDPNLCVAGAAGARTTSSTYDSRGQFPVTATNALGQSETRGYDARFGVVTSLTGPNGLTTSWEYDSLGRIKREIRADGTQTTVSRVWCSGGQSCPSLAFFKVTTQVTGSPASHVYHDQYQREMRVVSTGFDGQLIYVDTQFDSRGRVLRKSEPYFANAGNIYWTVPTYDALDRQVTVTYPRDDGSQSIATTTYQPFVTITTDANGHTNSERRNANGNIVSVTDAADNTISYDYDSVGNLIATLDPNGNSILNTYDIRGRKIAMSDPDMGQWSYTYNAFGELVSQTDAKGQTTAMTYDALGRMTSRTDLAGTTNAQLSTWTYDMALKGIGKLAAMSGGANTSQTFAYDALGRVESSTYSIMGQTFTVAQSYDSAGRLDTITYPASTAYPGGLQVQRSYQNGFLRQVKNAASGDLYWQADARTERGQVYNEALGNGLLTLRDYSPANGWMRTVRTTNVFGQALQYNDYHFDQVGNLSRRVDMRPGQGITENFSYDTLDRLTGSTFTNAPAGGGYTNKTYAYDALGNITSKSDVGAYTYGSCNAGPHAVCGAGGRSYTYDANGNMVSGGGRTVNYTSFNKPFYLAENSNHVYYLYGPDRNRVYKEAFNSNYDRTTYFVGLGDTGGTLFQREVENGSAQTTDKHFIYADGKEPVAQIVAKGSTATAQYFHRDHLGSVEVISDFVGNVVNDSSFDAWGLRRGNDWKDMSAGQYSLPLLDLTFTNHENIAEVGLIHMNGRVYDPLLGRFLSADPNIEAPYNLQSYNRYSYVMNNPLRYTDPSGYFLGGLFKAIGKALKNPYVRMAIAIVAATYTGFAASGWASGVIGSTLGGSALAATAATAAIGGAAAGFVGAGIMTGDFKAAMQGAMFGALAAATANFVGHAANLGAFTSLAHGVTQGAISEIRGESFTSGFWSGFLSHEIPLDGLGGQDMTGRVVRTLAAAAVGGTASALAGGKFANGAVTGAFVRLFNDEWGQALSDEQRKDLIANAEEWKGTPYATKGTEYAGKNAEIALGADCSGYISAVYRDSGANYGYMTASSFTGDRITLKGGYFLKVEVPQIGDIVKYSFPHVSIYAGNGMIWSARSTGKNLGKFSEDYFDGGKGNRAYYRYFKN